LWKGKKPCRATERHNGKQGTQIPLSFARLPVGLSGKSCKIPMSPNVSRDMGGTAVMRLLIGQNSVGGRHQTEPPLPAMQRITIHPFSDAAGRAVRPARRGHGCMGAGDRFAAVGLTFC